MHSANLNSYTLWELPIDTLTFVGASATTCALYGVSVVDPSGIGALLSAGVNALSITTICRLLKTDQNQAAFLKVCAILSALAFSTIALPYTLGLLATTVTLSYETALTYAGIHLIAKMVIYGLYRMGTAAKRQFLVAKDPENVVLKPGSTISLFNKISFKLPTLRSIKNRCSSLYPVLVKIKHGSVNTARYIGRVAKNMDAETRNVILSGVALFGIALTLSIILQRLVPAPPVVNTSNVTSLLPARNVTSHFLSGVVSKTTDTIIEGSFSSVGNNLTRFDTLNDSISTIAVQQTTAPLLDNAPSIDVSYSDEIIQKIFSHRKTITNIGIAFFLATKYRQNIIDTCISATQLISSLCKKIISFETLNPTRIVEIVDAIDPSFNQNPTY